MYRLFDLILKNNIISEKQYGIKKNFGTKGTLKQDTVMIYENINNNHPTIATFLDLQKAFNTVNHDILD